MISLLLLLSPLGIAAGPLTACSAERQGSHTNVLLPAVGTVVSFELDSGAPADEMIGILLELFQEPPLQGTLSCNPLSNGNSSLSCSQRNGDDSIIAWFDGETRTFSLLLTPVTSEPGYQPDFEYFHALEEMVGQALIAAFGADAVAINPERR